MEAVAVAGAGAAVGATIKIVLENLLSYHMEEIGLLWYFKKDFKKLKYYVTMIRDLLEDAEMKPVTEKSVQRWLMKLEDVAFDADYVFDQLNYQHLRKKVQRGSKMKKKVRCFFPNSKSFSFHHRMARNIKNVRDEFKKINQEAKELGLQVILATAPARGVRTDESNAYYKDPVFVGRENDARKIVEMVNNSPTERISVIPIVGMGGLGKTTLARKVFHDHTILSRFDENCRLWIHVSETFVPKTVFEEVLKLLTGEIISGQRDQFVLGKLQEKIKDKRYLLVLDDVWCDDREKWDEFINPLEAISSLKGNVVIVTTRNKNVASIVKTNDMHELRVLSDEDCWGIIKAKAFKGDNIPSEFEMIVGKRIAKRCGGLPLAAKVIGGLLSGKTEDEWSSIENKWLSDFGGINVGDHVFLKVSPSKGVTRFGKGGKLRPRFIGPFEILNRIGLVAYELALPPNIGDVHNVFHVSMLRKYLYDPSHTVNHEEITLNKDMTYEEEPIAVLDKKVHELRNRQVTLIKVQWSRHGKEEATWEREKELRAKYPTLE